MTNELATPSPMPKAPTAKSTSAGRIQLCQSPHAGGDTPLQTFEELTAAQLEKAIKTAKACFRTWQHTSFSERAAIVAKAARIMRGRANEFGKLVTLETGKPAAEACEEVGLSANILEYYARNAERFLTLEQLKPSFVEVVIETAPFGVCFDLQLWSFPYYQLARLAAPSLMAGNVVMVKHAGCVPQCAVAFENLWLEAGAPAGVCTTVFIDQPTGTACELTSSCAGDAKFGHALPSLTIEEFVNERPDRGSGEAQGHRGCEWCECGRA